MPRNRSSECILDYIAPGHAVCPARFPEIFEKSNNKSTSHRNFNLKKLLRIRTNKVWSLILVAFALAACVEHPRVAVEEPPTRALLDESYILGPGDELKIVVFNHVDLSAPCVVKVVSATPAGQVVDETIVVIPDSQSSRCAVVSDAGTISSSLVGEIPAAGRTIEAVRQDYADRLADGYLVNPQVIASINKYRPFFIIGGVDEPGEYEYQSDLTVAIAIALAGGRSHGAIRGTPPRLRRANGVLVPKDNVTFDTVVLPGDFIEILVAPPLPNEKKLKPKNKMK